MATRASPGGGLIAGIMAAESVESLAEAKSAVGFSVAAVGFSVAAVGLAVMPMRFVRLIRFRRGGGADREDPVARVGHVVMGTRLEPEAQVGPEGQMVPEALAERAVTGAMREHS